MFARRPLFAIGLMLVSLPAFAQAQTAGGVPPYEPPPPAQAPVRDGEVMAKSARASANAVDRGAVISAFSSAYAKHGKPRIALYWNRQLGETLSDWYSDVRVVEQSDSRSSMSGDFNLNQSGSTQNSFEVQRRVQDSRRVATTESFEWEFQDAFLAPFLEAGATIIDRAAMIRLTSVDVNSTNDRLVETHGLLGKADYLMEILVAANSKSTTGYELRTRILDVKTGAIIATVNSKNQKEWAPDKEIIATDQGFVTPDDDDDSFGPVGDNRYRATAQGFEKRRKPPKLSAIAQTLAYNTMTGLNRHWK